MPAPAESAAPAAWGDEGRARLLLLLLGAGVALATAPYVPGLLGALVLFVLAAPLHRRLTDGRRGRRARGVALAITAAAAVLALVPGTWLLTTATAEAAEALRRLQDSGLLARLALVHVAGVELATLVRSASATVLSGLPDRALSFFGSATRATLNLVVALFGVYYLLVAGPGLWQRIRRLLPFAPAVADQLRARFVAVTEAMLLGTLLTALLQGLLVGVAFAVLGLHGAVLWGVVTACVSVLPVLGSGLVWVPGALVLVLQQRYGAALALLGFGAVVVANLDNVVRMVVYRRLSGVHPMITLVGAFAGVGVFGLAGVLLGPLALLYFFELLRAYDRSFGAARRVAGPECENTGPAGGISPIAAVARAP